MMELKPCPFCGSRATRLCAYDRNDIIKLIDEEEHEIALGVGVYCRNCGVRTRFFKEGQEAVDAWNRREMKTGKKIKQCRKEKGWTQRQLAEKLGITAAMVGMWETGRRNPKPATLKRIADALGTEIVVQEES